MANTDCKCEEKTDIHEYTPEGLDEVHAPKTGDTVAANAPSGAIETSLSELAAAEAEEVAAAEAEKVAAAEAEKVAAAEEVVTVEAEVEEVAEVAGEDVGQQTASNAPATGAKAAELKDAPLEIQDQSDDAIIDGIDFKKSCVGISNDVLYVCPVLPNGTCPVELTSECYRVGVEVTKHATVTWFF